MRSISKNITRTICSALALSLLTNTGGFINLNDTVYAAMAQAEDEDDEYIYEDNFYRTIQQISLSDTHALALDNKGHVYSQGTNLYGQLGAGDNTNELKDVDLSECLPEISKVWAFDNISFFLAKNGSLYVCGDNTNKQLGIENDICYSPIRIDFFEKNKVQIKNILHSNNATFFITTDGEVFACGDNHTGWFGQGNNLTRSMDLQKLSIKDTVGTLVDFAVGDGFAVAINQNGEIYFAGDNSSGQCGFDSMKEDFYPVFTKLPLTVKDLDSDCYHTKSNISSYRLFAGGNLYSVAPGCIVDKTLANIYQAPEGTEIYPELLIFNLSDEIKDDYFLGEFKQPFQTKIEKDGVHCKKITNFSVSPIYIYSIQNIYHTNNFTAILGRSSTGELTLTCLGDANNVNWSGFDIVEDGIIKTFPLMLPQDGNDGVSAVDISFAKNHFIYKTIDKKNITKYLYTESCQITDQDRSKWFHRYGPYLALSQDDIDAGFFEKAHSSIFREFENKQVSLEINKETTIQFKTQGNTNFIFEIDNPDVCSVKNISSDKKEITIKALNEGDAVLKAVEKLPDGSEKVIDTCNIHVSFVAANVNAKFNKNNYILTEGNNEYIEYSSDVPNLDVTFSTEDKSIATVDKFMQLTAVHPGTTKIFAKYKDSVLAEATITVLAYSGDIEIKGHDLKVAVGKTVPLSEYISINRESELSNLTYQSEDTSICTINQTDGTMTAVAKGKTRIKVSHPSGVYDYINVEVAEDSISAGDIKITLNKAEYSLKRGSSVGLDIAINPISELKNITLKSENESVCKVDNSKLTIEAVGAGDTYVTVSHPKTGAMQIKVSVYDKPQITVPTKKEIKVGQRIDLGVKVTPESEQKNITYRSLDSDICSVNSSGELRGVAVGKTKIITLYNGEEYNETAVTVVKESSGTKDNKELAYSIESALNADGEMDLLVGETATFTVRLKNETSSTKKSSYKPKVKVVSGKNKIDIDTTDDDFKFTITGKKSGHATIEIYNNKKDIESLQVDVNISYFEIDEDKVSISTGIIKNDSDNQNDKTTKEQATKIEMNEKHQLKVSGTNKLNMEDFFDDYFSVDIDGDSIKYLGNGIVKAIKPGISIVTVRNEDNGDRLGRIKYWVPFPKDYFVVYPSDLAIPKDREISIRFNDSLRSSTVTKDSVFIQSAVDGNGEDLKATIRVVGNNVYIKLKDSNSVVTGKYYVFFTDDVRNTKDEEIISPIAIPIYFIDKQ